MNQEEKDRNILKKLEDIVYETYESTDIDYFYKKVDKYEKKYDKEYFS